jgi:hypothetical protein
MTEIDSLRTSDEDEKINGIEKNNTIRDYT